MYGHDLNGGTHILSIARAMNLDDRRYAGCPKLRGAGHQVNFFVSKNGFRERHVGLGDVALKGFGRSQSAGARFAPEFGHGNIGEIEITSVEDGTLWIDFTIPNADSVAIVEIGKLYLDSVANFLAGCKPFRRWQRSASNGASPCRPRRIRQSS